MLASLVGASVWLTVGANRGCAEGGCGRSASLEKETEKAVISDYLKAWQNMSQAFEENQIAPLDDYFVGVAKEKLAATVRGQQGLGIKTRYSDRSHDIHLVFYSPEGLSIQLLDTVEYDVQVLDKDRLVGTEHVRARYVAVLTPTEVRWKVRVFQAEPE